MECGVEVADLYFCRLSDIVCEISFDIKGKELIISVFIISDDVNTIRLIYILAVGGLNMKVQ